MARSSLQIVLDQRTPVVASDKTPKAGRQLMRKIIRQLEGALMGSIKASHIIMNIDGAQPIAASATFAFLATVAANDTGSINGIAQTATALRAHGTVTAASVQANDTVTVGVTVFTAVNGGTPTSIQFDMSGSDTQTAAALVAAINAHPTASTVAVAKNAAGVVTVAALLEGAAGNGVVVLASSNNTRLAVAGGVSGGKLAAGADPTTDQFDFEGTAVMTARSFARSILASTTALVVNHVEAANWAASVTLATCPAGAKLYIGMHEFTAVAAAGNSPNVFDGDFSIVSTDTNDAIALRNAINVHPVLSHSLVASSSSGVVTIRQRRGTSAYARLSLGGVVGSGLAITTQFTEVATVLVSALHEGNSGNAITTAESTSGARITVSGARATAGTGAATGTTVRHVMGNRV